MIDPAQFSEQVGDLKPARRDLPEYRRVREVERRAAVKHADDPTLAAKKQRLAAFLERNEEPDPNGLRGGIFDARV